MGKPNINAAISGKVNTAKTPKPMPNQAIKAAIGKSKSGAKQSVTPAKKEGNAGKRSGGNKHAVSPAKTC